MKVLTIEQPWANLYVHKIGSGIAKYIYVAHDFIPYRGSVAICAANGPKVGDLPCGCLLGVAELWAVKPTEEMTKDEWNATQLPVSERKNISGYAYMLRNVQRIVEIPSINPLGLSDADVDDVITPYPEHVTIDKKAWKSFKKTKKIIKQKLA